MVLTRRWVPALAIVLSLVGAFSTQASATSAPRALYWSTVVVRGTTPVQPGPGLNAIDCPAVGSCVVGTQTGTVLLGLGLDGAGATWTQVVGPSSGSVTSLSCVSTTLCVAVTDDGSVLASTAPLDPTSVWSRVVAAPGSLLISVQCPSITVCFAADAAGRVLVARTPLSRHWPAVILPAGSIPTSLSCPTATLCAVGTEDGKVLTASVTKMVSGSWRQAQVSPDSISALQCPSTSLCVAEDGTGGLLTSGSAFSKAAQWSPQLAPSTTLSSGGAISCPTATFCAVSDAGHELVATTTPTGGSASWTPKQIGSAASSTTGLSCVSSAWCAASTASGEIAVSPNPRFGKWTTSHVTWISPIHSVTCLTSGQCLAGTAGGDLLASPSPAALAPWQVSAAKGADITAISCPSETLCVAVDTMGSILRSTNPFDVSPTWSSSSVTGGTAFVAASCPTTSWCAAVDAAGLLWWSANPTVDGTWTATTSAVDDAALSGLDCPAADECLVSDLSGTVQATSSVSTSSGWTSSPLATGEGLSSLVCTPSGACLVAAYGGAVLRSADPFDPTPVWTVTATLPVEARSLACPTDSWCTAMAGGPVTSTDAGATWSTLASGAVPVVGYQLACTGPTLCVVSGDTTLSIGLAPTATSHLTIKPITATAFGVPVTVRATVSQDGGSLTPGGTVSITAGDTVVPGCEHLVPTGVGRVTCAVASLTATSVTATYSGVGIAVAPSSSQLSVALSPVFTTQPSAQSKTAAKTFTETVAINAPPGTTLSWEISSDKVSFTPISGATGTTVAIPAASIPGVHWVRAVATSGAQSAWSTIAKLTTI